ncbi:DUF397 domain-containing protein [Spongiactinospora rosea]|uniref:DUF397 domain-containing protein n=2 Tax=Spongiactinospora rosea TaxID=2248750 RepID=A0A366LVE9_9ACTN|nr:DUF397 domain-containing protein [Spongiactinospora rosea]
MDKPRLSIADLADIVWRKSSHSGSGGGDCLEVADGVPGVVGVRDSKDSTGPALCFSPDEWRVFLKRVKAGDFD